MSEVQKIKSAKLPTVDQKANKRQWSETDARDVIDRLRLSGCSVVKFCAREGIGVFRVQYWLHRLKQLQQQGTKSQVAVGFVQVKPPSEECVSIQVCIEHPATGWRVTISGDRKVVSIASELLLQVVGK